MIPIKIISCETVQQDILNNVISKFDIDTYNLMQSDLFQPLFSRKL